MNLRQKYLRILSAILPAGAVGASLLLGSAVSATASEDPAASQPPAADPARVSERLAAIRGVVSDVSGDRQARGEGQVAWWANWRNGGGGGYGAWRNGGYGAWRNGGYGAWRNGGWYGGGWRNGWPNYWRNW